jgi:hypothetical protein
VVDCACGYQKKTKKKQTKSKRIAGKKLAKKKMAAPKKAEMETKFGGKAHRRP